jgi:4-carboxymuconolactone decarboxylase
MADDNDAKSELYLRGMVLRREVLGDAHVDRSLQRAASDPFLQPVQDMATEFGWGAVWARPGLERKTRSFLSITCLAALGKHDELRTHIRGALNNGATRDEIREVILHAGVYCGVPVALECTRIAKEVLDDAGA